MELFQWDMQGVPNVKGRTIKQAIEALSSRGGYVVRVDYEINKGKKTVR